MKVVQINAVNRIGSTGDNTYELHRYLIDHGHESHVFCTNENNPTEHIYRIGNNIDYKTHALLSRITGKQGYFSFFSTKKLIAELNLINPDIVILGNLHSNFINLNLLLKYLSKKKIATIMLLHDCWFFTGHCCHYTKINCNRWKTECHKCPLIKEDNPAFIDRSRKVFHDRKKLYSEITKLGVIGVSNWITNEAKQSSLFPKGTQFNTIYNWINPTHFKAFPQTEARTILGLDKFGFYAVSTSNLWIPEKGLNHIITLAAIFPESKFILIGNKPKLEAPPENIIFTGPILDKERLSLYYSASNVYLNLSSQETFGKVSAEALLCGTPVLTNNLTANPEIVGDCGEISHINDIKIFQEKFALFMKDPTYKKNNTCIERAKNLFDKDRNLNEYISFMKSLLKPITFI